jgi:hypothetical protein
MKEGEEIILMVHKLITVSVASAASLHFWRDLESFSKR